MTDAGIGWTGANATVYRDHIRDRASVYMHGRTVAGGRTMVHLHTGALPDCKAMADAVNGVVVPPVQTRAPVRADH